jgi:hypothetical protein
LGCPIRERGEAAKQTVSYLDDISKGGDPSAAPIERKRVEGLQQQSKHQGGQMRAKTAYNVLHILLFHVIKTHV